MDFSILRVGEGSTKGIRNESGGYPRPEDVHPVRVVERHNASNVVGGNGGYVEYIPVGVANSIAPRRPGGPRGAGFFGNSQSRQQQPPSSSGASTGHEATRLRTSRPARSTCVEKKQCVGWQNAP